MSSSSLMALGVAAQARPTPGGATAAAAKRGQHADFGAAFERAERPPDHEVRKPDARQDAPTRDTPDARRPAASPEAKPAAPAQADTDADATRMADAAAADKATEAESAQNAAAEDALTADQKLQLMIATGIPQGPTIQTPTEAAAVATTTAAAVAVTAAQTAQLAVTPAETGTPAAQPVLPLATAASVDDLAASLNVTGLQVDTTTAPGEAPVAPTLSLALAEAAEDQAAPLPVTGSITPATTSDDASGIEALSLQALPLDEAGLTETTDPDATSAQVTLAVADKPAGEVARAGVTATPRPDAAPQPDEVMPQLLKHAEALKSQQNNAIKLQLYPEHLGKMEIKVTSHQGVLSAQFTADSHSVKAMLETQVASLQRSLQELGIKVDKVEVALASADLGGFASGQQPGDPSQQQFGQQGGDRRYDADLGYSRWLEPDAGEAEAQAQTAGETTTAINYVA